MLDVGRSDNIYARPYADCAGNAAGCGGKGAKTDGRGEAMRKRRPRVDARKSEHGIDREVCSRRAKGKIQHLRNGDQLAKGLRIVGLEALAGAANRAEGVSNHEVEIEL